MLSNLQYLRAFAAINVVYLHVLIGGNSYDRPSTMFPILGEWGANGVDIFFVISGFVMIYSQINNPKTIVNFYKSRLLRIVPIYWLITFTIIILFTIFPDIFRTFETDFKKSISSFLFTSQLVTNEFPIINVGWTLEWEMLFYLIFGISIYFKKLERIVLFIFFSMIIIFLISKNLFFLEFFVGVIIGYIYFKFKINHFIALIILIIGVISLSLSIDQSSQIVSYDRFIIWGLPSALIVFGAVNTKPLNNKIFFYLGNASYSIYLVQVLTIPAFYKAIDLLKINLNNDVLSIICLLSSVIFGCFFHTFVEKKLK